MKKTFLTGLILLLPVAVTVWVVRFLIHLLTHPFLGLMTRFLREKLWYISLSQAQLEALGQLAILVLLVILVFLLGFVGHRFFFHSLLQWGEKIWKKVPLVNKIYGVSKELIGSFFSDKSTAFQQVVMLSFPYPGAYCLGIVTSQSKDDEIVSVFLPTTPNPSTGFLVRVPQKELTFLKMSSEEAIKYIVSCGVIQPKGKTP